MKKLIVYYPGKWAESLLTVERYREIAYFVTDDTDSTVNCNMPADPFCKKTYDVSILDGEDKDSIIILIADNARYSRARELLQSKGFIENKHFFNAWKLDFGFYKEYYSDSSWQSFEKEHTTVISDNSYDRRAKIMSELIPEDVHSVMDLGCGDAFLKQYLRPDVEYYGLDICEREHTSFVCDLNVDPLPPTTVDMYFMAGLLYYINDIDNLFSQMTNAKYILYDYGGTERYLRLDGVPHDNLINARNNFFSHEEIFNALHKNGFTMENALWDYNNGKIGWHIYLFRKTL